MHGIVCDEENARAKGPKGAGSRSGNTRQDVPNQESSGLRSIALPKFESLGIPETASREEQLAANDSDVLNLNGGYQRSVLGILGVAVGRPQASGVGKEDLAI